MNVMKKAHEDTRSLMAQYVGKYSYREVFAAMMVNAHYYNKQEIKKMQEEQAKKEASKAFAINHFEDCIEKTVAYLDKVGINDYYIAIENNAQLHDYTLLQHKDVNDVQSPLGWANYENALRTHSRQADEYVKSFPGVVKLHAQTHLMRVVEFMQEQLKQVKK